MNEQRKQMMHIMEILFTEIEGHLKSGEIIPSYAIRNLALLTNNFYEEEGRTEESEHIARRAVQVLTDISKGAEQICVNNMRNAYQALIEIRAKTGIGYDMHYKGEKTVIEEECRDELLTRGDIAWKYGLSYEDVEKMAESAKFPRHYLTQSGGWVYPMLEVETFLEENNFWKRGGANNDER
jgi:hypothetical protein